MDYKYIHDVEYVENIIDLFLEFVSKQPEQHGLKPSFSNGYLAHHENFKLSVFFRANELMDAGKWSKKAIASGAAADMAIRAMNVYDNKFVAKYQKMDFADRLRADPVRGSQILYDFYNYFVSDEEALEQLAGFFGRKYDTLSYLFFLKNWKEYLPCKKQLFVPGFESMGIDTECFGPCTYANYSAFNAALAELADVFSNYAEKISVLDAHSFVWIIAHYDKARNYIFGDGRIEVIDSDPKKEGMGRVKTRLNQTEFRRNVVAFWDGKCCVTGCGKTDVLIASHIKPWRACATRAESVDPYNGLLLVPNLDKLFDAGYISFEDDGRVIFSPELSEEDAAKMGVTKDTKVTGLMPGHRKYLEYHRENILRCDALEKAGEI